MTNQENLDLLFGGFKAEWLRENIFDLFTEPSYFGELKDSRPFVLQGGRGTGKTTVLRGLSYQGQFEILKKDINAFDANNFIGVYFRANTNHVRAFGGKGVPEDRWVAMFEHYINIVLCREIVRFLTWHKLCKGDEQTLSVKSCQQIARSLCITSEIVDFQSLCDAMDDALLDFQASLNNVADGDYPQLSLCSVPIQLLTQQIRNLPQFADKMIYLLIDEYENFSDLQQESMNTMLKHTDENYTFKIGVREMGWRVKHTHNPLESLNHPADYYLYRIEETFTKDDSRRFEEFAKNICNQRLRRLVGDKDDNFTIEKALINLSIEDEAISLHIKKNKLLIEFETYEKEHGLLLDIHPLYKYTIAYWAHTHGTSLEEELQDYLNNTAKWTERYDNYKYSMLFKINKGRGGVTIQKYYSGWNTFVKLANGNIRYLMSLVHQSYSNALRDSGDDIRYEVTPEQQTMAAKNVGWMNLTELEGSCEKGLQLTKLVQSFGSIFRSLATEGEKTAPEVVQFEFDGEVSERTRELIKMGVMNLALVRMSANKLATNNVKDFQYALHPMFAPYFNFSFRRKRKMTITDEDFIGSIDNPSSFVADFLKKKNIKVDFLTANLQYPTLFDVDEFLENEKCN